MYGLLIWSKKNDLIFVLDRITFVLFYKTCVMHEVRCATKTKGNVENIEINRFVLFLTWLLVNISRATHWHDSFLVVTSQVVTFQQINIALLRKCTSVTFAVYSISYFSTHKRKSIKKVNTYSQLLTFLLWTRKMT